MWPVFQALLAIISTTARSRFSLQLEVAALRHQLSVYRRFGRESGSSDRRYPGSGQGGVRSLSLYDPPRFSHGNGGDSVEHWARISRHGPPGRPTVSKKTQDLIGRISRANPDWGSPRIVGELGKLGITVAKSTVERYRVRPSRPPSPTWRAFLKNHVAISFRSTSLRFRRSASRFCSCWSSSCTTGAKSCTSTSPRTRLRSGQRSRSSKPLLGARPAISASGSRRDFRRSISPAGPVQPGNLGTVVEIQDVGGLHRHYERMAA